MEYHEALKELKRWENIKKRNGTNYVIEQYINKYQNIIESIEGPQGQSLKIEKNPPLTKREWNDMIRKKIKNLERKMKQGKATWQDIFVHDVWLYDDPNKWRLPI